MAIDLDTIFKRVCARIPVTKPTTYVGNSDQTATTVLEAIRQAGEDLLNHEFPFPIIIKEHPFTTSVGVTQYSLPTNFHDFVDRTLWDITNFTEMRGGLSPGEWQYLKNSVLGSSTSLSLKFRLRESSNVLKFEIDPSPTTADNLVFEHKTKAWIQTSGGADLLDFAADTDLVKFPDQLIVLGALWRTLSDLGFPSASKLAEYEDALERHISRQGGPARPIDFLSQGDEVKFIGPENVPDTNYGS